MNGYCCIACATTQAADFAGFVCPSCGSNLEVTYDYAAIRNEFVQDFDYSPFLPVSRLVAPFPLRVGTDAAHCRDTPRRNRWGLGNLYLKDETRNPSASTKDRATAVALRRARDVGAETVAVASTGNAGSSLACLAAALDHACRRFRTGKRARCKTHAGACRSGPPCSLFVEITMTPLTFA